MRVLVLVVAALGLVGVAGCDDGSRPCAAPTGCASAARVNGTCTCAEWETVSTETVALPYVLVGVEYPPVGTASVFRYGFTWDPSMVPSSASTLGTTFRTVIRRPDGSEQIARVGAVEPGFSAASQLTDTALRVDAGGVWTHTTGVDLPSEADSISVWVNPAVTVVTDFVGEKTVSWTSRTLCLWPGLDCTRPQFQAFSPALLRGETSGVGPVDAYLDQIGPEARAALLAFDPREAGEVRFPRYQSLADVTVDATTRPVDATWQPCLDPAEFEVLAETAVPLEGGDTFVVQYGALPDAACTPQRPGLLVGTTTTDCSIRAQVLVDRLSGTLLMQPSSSTGACTAN